jgi:hypothetical protein
MSKSLRSLSTVLIALFGAVANADAAEQKYFNQYMMRAYEVLKKNHGAKYNNGSYFTKNLDYGEQKAAIKASNPPYTMCNAAVTEVIIEAINLYAADHKGWSPQATVPASSWTTAQWSQLMPHIFSHDYMGYDPLDSLQKAHIPIERGLKLDIRNFQSEHGMSIALEKFGLGESIKFEDARPGDVVSFDRDLMGGGAKPGHSVILLAFLTRDQKEVPTYGSGEIVGLKYFSVQSSEPAGLGERWAYFKVAESRKTSIGMCPYSDDKKMPSDPKKSYCPDALDTEANRAKFPVMKSNQPRDCCVVRYGEDAPRVGRVLMPPWNYIAKQKKVQEAEAKLKDHVEEFMENLSRAGERLKLYATGALALEKDNPREARSYLRQVQLKFNIDLRAIAGADALPEIGQRQLHEISLITPASVIAHANRQVTTKLKIEMEQRFRTTAQAKVDLLHSPKDGGPPNPRFDGQSAN